MGSFEHEGIRKIHDGNWSVLIVTEKGTCDRGYRYNVRVANGQVSFQGDAAINLAGTVAPDGAIKVSIKVGEKAPTAPVVCRTTPGPALGTALARAALALVTGKPSGDRVCLKRNKSAARFSRAEG